MASTSLLSRVPVLRILIPFILGIIIAKSGCSAWIAAGVMVVAVGMYLLLHYISRSPQERLRWRSFFIVPLATAAMSLGWMSAIIHCPPQLSQEQCHSGVIYGRIVDLDYTDFSMRQTIKVISHDLPPCHVLVSTRGCDYTMQAGDVIAWEADLHNIGNLGNPGETDYADFLLNSYGIRYEQHLPLRQIKKIGHSPTLSTHMANIRRDLALKVFNSRLSPPAQRFVIAILLGDSGFIDKSTRQEFSSAGVAHVLALSGLHIGFIALFIWWILFPLDYLRLKKLRLFITIVAMMIFAVFTGLSPSVIRATVMTGIVFISYILYRRSLALNSLAIAALVILVFSPSALYSVGFQLSFITTGAVLTFARIPDGIKSRYKWINNITSIVITSLVAMLATMALSAHYFHTVSFLSVLSNLLILPVLPLMMVLGALFLLVTTAGMQWPIMERGIDGLYSYIHGVTAAVNSLPLSHVGNIYVSTAGVIGCFIVMALVAIWLYHRKFCYLLAAGIMFVLLLTHSLWLDLRTPRQGMVIFNSFSSTPVLYYNQGKGYVWTPDEEEPDSAAFARYYAGFMAQHRIDELYFVSDHDTLRFEDNMIRPPIAYLMGHRLMAVGSGRWKNTSATHRLRLDDLVITKRFHGTVEKLQELYSFDRIVISGAHYESERLRHECDTLGVKSIELKTQGALLYQVH